MWLLQPNQRHPDERFSPLIRLQIPLHGPQPLWIRHRPTPTLLHYIHPSSATGAMPRCTTTWNSGRTTRLLAGHFHPRAFTAISGTDLELASCPGWKPRLLDIPEGGFSECSGDTGTQLPSDAVVILNPVASASALRIHVAGVAITLLVKLTAISGNRQLLDHGLVR
jgi:hypothetical protein